MRDRPKGRAIGSRGSWFAKVDEEFLPCIHKHWLKGMQYHDPNCILGERHWGEYVAAIRSLRKVILTTDDIIGEGPSFQRTGYIGVFSVDDVSVDGRDLRLRLIDRLADL